jgi:phage-related tail protein
MKRILPLCLLLLGSSAHGALNKWVDADGTVHYSDEPPPPTAKTTKTVSVPSPASGAFATQSLSEREKELKKSQQSAEENEKKSAEQQQIAAAKQKNCEGAKSNLRTLENSPSVITYDANNKPVPMDESARKQATEDTRKAISENCGEP